MLQTCERICGWIICITIWFQSETNGFGILPSARNPLNFSTETRHSKNIHPHVQLLYTRKLKFPSKKGEEEEEYDDYDFEEYYEYEEVDEVGDDDNTGLNGEDDNVDESLPLQDDPEDKNYNTQKMLVDETVARRKALDEMKKIISCEDSSDLLIENMESFLDESFEKAGLDLREVENRLENIQLSDEEIKDSIQLMDSKMKNMDHSDFAKAFLTDLGSDGDAFPDDGDPVYTEGIQKKDLLRLQKNLEELTGTIKGFEDGSMIDNKQAMIRPKYELDKLDPQIVDEIQLCLNASATDANGLEYFESVKLEDPIRWLLYDLDFNVTNLMLASCKYCPESPLILNHWMPQLCAYSRYFEVRDRGFKFTWADCENSDITELERYYHGLGYDKIPTFSPQETNIVNLDTEYDQEDMTMAHFENWMDEVYVEADENLYFDDEDFQPENNVFDFKFGMEESEEVSSFKAELKEFYTEHQNETQAFKDKYVRETKYSFKEDTQGSEKFRGHLVVACCGSDQDLELAEKITKRMADEFDKQIYVETRVYSHARQEDNLYEIWLESYDIELLHSRRGAFYNAKQWPGPADVDEIQLNNIVDRVRYMISDDARYSYDLHEFEAEV